jgi:predicted ester cyclase
MTTEEAAIDTSAQTNADIVIRFLHEMFVDANLDALGDFVTAPGLAALLRQDVPQMHATLTDIRVEMGQTVSEGDRVAVDFTLIGTPREGALPTPPPADIVAIANMCIFTLSDGKIARAVVLADRLGLFQQLGIREVPPLAPCPASGV